MTVVTEYRLRCDFVNEYGLCDGGCEFLSPRSFSKYGLLKLAVQSGWNVDDSTGKVICSSCRKFSHQYICVVGHSHT